MTRRVLIVDEDKRFATELWSALKQLGDYRITTARTLNEACLSLIQETQELVFLPLSNDERPIRSLLVLQSDLHIVLTTPNISETGNLNPSLARKARGVLPKDRMATALPGILDIIFEATGAESQSVEPHSAIHTGTLGPQVQAALLLQGERLITYWGRLAKGEANLIAEAINQNWSEADKTAQVQFLRLPEQSYVLMLYTRVMAASQKNGAKQYLLTLVSSPEVSLSWLRSRADKLVGNLGNVVQPTAVPLPQPATVSFAIAWRTQQAIPQIRLIPIKRILERVAIANACALTHIDVQSHLIHLVVSCPPGRNSSWASHLLKSGSEEIIQQEYGETRPLWAIGHYARESAEPLTPAELNIFLPKQ